MACSQPKVQFEQLPDDIICEILSHLPVEDIIRSRRVCQWLQGATHQRAVWSNAYLYSKLLRPEGPMSTQTAQDLEDLLVRAAKIQRKWSAYPGVQPVSRKFMDGLPPYKYGVDMVSGRYLIVGIGTEISWYDLDRDEAERLDVPVATYDMGVPGAGPAVMQFLSAQANANGEGPDTAYVTFFADRCMKALKVRLSPSNPSIEAIAEFSSFNDLPAWDRLQSNYLLVRSSLTFKLRLFHIPTKQEYAFPLGSENTLTASYWNWIITATHLIIMIPRPHRHETDVVVFDLPTELPSSSSVSRLAIAHTAVYPYSIWRADCIFEAPPNELGPFDARIRVLAICHEGHDHQTPTNLECFDILIPSVGTVEFLRHSCSLLQGVSPGTMKSVLTTSCSTVSLALSYSQPAVNPIDGQVIMMHDIKPGIGTAEGTIVTNRLTLPGEKEHLRLVAFDGFRGRVCFDVRGAERPRIEV